MNTQQLNRPESSGPAQCTARISIGFVAFAILVGTAVGIFFLVRYVT